MPELEWIKRAYKRSQGASGSASPRERSPARRTIMIVDDNPHIIEALGDVLRGKYSVVACSSAEEVEQRYTDDLGLVLLDIKMTPVDGITIFSMLRRKSERLPIVIHTAYPGDSEAVARLRELSPAGFLMKGDYSLQHLDATVERAIGAGADGGGPP